MERRRANDCVIAVGSNLGDRESTIVNAVKLLGERVGEVVARSHLRETAAVVPDDCPIKNQPNYLNGAVRIRTQYSAEEVLTKLLAIEGELGRNRKSGEARNLPRTIDLDLIAYGEEIIQTENLTIPHPRMHERLFVLEPFAEVWPEWVHPILRKTVTELLSKCF